MDHSGNQALVCSGPGCGARCAMRGYRAQATYACKKCGARLVPEVLATTAALPQEEAGDSATVPALGEPGAPNPRKDEWATVEATPAVLERFAREGCPRVEIQQGGGTSPTATKRAFARYLDPVELARRGMGAI